MKLAPGEVESVVPPADLKITNISLGNKLEDENARTSLRLVYQKPKAPESDDEEEEEKEEDEEDDVEIVETFLGSLTPGKVWMVFDGFHAND